MVEEKQPVRVQTAVEKFAEASEIRRQGFKNKIEACGFQAEIDDMILNKHWSSQVIVNELLKNHPEVTKKQIPSWKSIDNYKKRYLNGKDTSVHKFPTAMKKAMTSICMQFDSYSKLIDLANTMIERAELGKGMEDKTGMPLRERTIILRDAKDAILQVLNKEIEMGLRPKALINFMEGFGKLVSQEEDNEEDYDGLLKQFEIKLTEFKGTIAVRREIQKKISVIEGAVVGEEGKDKQKEGT